MPNIKLIISYDGTEFFGFQRQPRHRSVQQVLEEALRKIFHKPIYVTPAGRTDTGVHAAAQVVGFNVETRIPVRRIPAALNSALPEDVRVLRAQKMPDRFHARYDARWKRYEYTVFNGKIIPPLIRRTVYKFPYRLDMALMKTAARFLEGKHDFRSFQGRANRQENTVRHVRTISVGKRGSLVRFAVEGDGFLSHMVRNLVGTILLVGCKKLSLNDLKHVLAGRDRRLAGPTAPPQGLTLVKVEY